MLLVPAVYAGEEILSSDVPNICSLKPLERNLHEIKPTSNDLAVIADIIGIYKLLSPIDLLIVVISIILAPPYDTSTNSFFYEIIDTTFDIKLNKPITWLFKTPHSEEFYCDTIPYTGPRIKVP